MVIVLADGKGNACLIRYVSWKSPHVTRPVKAAEVHASPPALTTLTLSTRTFCLCWARRFLFICLRIQFRPLTLLQSSPLPQRSDFSWTFPRFAKPTSPRRSRTWLISRQHSFADPLSRMNSPALTTLLDTGKLRHLINKWIIHSDSDFER